MNSEISLSSQLDGLLATEDVVLAGRGPVNVAWQALSSYERDSIVEFLKTLQILPEGTKFLVVDEKGNNKPWPPRN